MNCPGCGLRTIGFVRWSWCFNSWFWTCPHCGAPLRCSRATVGWLAVQVLVLVPWGALFAKSMFAIPPELPFPDFVTVVLTTSLIWLAIGVAVTTPFKYIAYRAGGYVSRGAVNAPDNKPAMPPARWRAPRARWGRRLWITAGLIVTAVIAGLVIGLYKSRPMLEAMACYKQGEAQYKRNQYDRAVASFTKAIEYYPKFAGAYEYRAYCYMARDEYAKALADLNDTLRIQPKNALALTNRAYVYDSQGDFDNAIIDLTQAIELNPKIASRWASRAYAHSHKAEFDKAIADFTEAIRLKPEIWQYYADRGNSYFYKVAFVKAFADFDKAQKMQRKSEQAEEEE
jgi:Flp pilus assembly protein TadD